MLKKLVLTVCALLSLFGLYANTEDRLLIIKNEKQFYNPAFNFSYLIEVENRLKIEDILTPEYQDKFISNTMEIPEFGMISSRVWLKSSIINQLDTSPFLEIENPVLDSIEYFLFNNQGVLVHHHLTGNYKKIKDREIQTSQVLIDLKLKKNQPYIMYLKVSSKSSSILMPMKIGSIRKYYEIKHSSSFWQGLYFGLILFLVIYNLFLFFSVKELAYLYFALFIASEGLLFALLKGFGIQYIWSNLPQLNQFTPIIGGFAGIFMILFTSNFLNSRIKTPIIHTWLLALICLYIIIIGLNIFGVHLLSLKLLVYNSLVVLFFLMFVAIKSWREGFEPSKYYLFAWSFFVFGFILFLFRENGWIPTNQFIGNILQLSSTVTILFMSFALGKKINIYIDKRNEAQELALHTALENEKLVSNQNQLLEAKVNQRTLELEQTISALNKHRKELHEANNFKDKVFSILSHDLKSPIATLAGLLKLTRTKSLTEIERIKIVDSLEVALKSTKYLLDNILEWANKSEKNPEITDEIELYGAIEEIFRLFQYQASLKQIQLINQSEKDFHILTNKNMLQLVLRNLVSNAIKFTSKDGSICVSMKQDFLDLSITVTDSGIGMSDDIKSSLFKANRHTSTRGTENEKGTGLGLMLCKEFVEKYNGTISVESKIGKGSSFTVRLRNAIPVLETVLN